MIPFEVELGPDGGYRCHAGKPHTLIAMWLENDVGRDGGGSMEEFFEELRELLDGRREVAMTGGDAVHVVVDRSGATLGFFQLSEREGTDDLIDAVLRWFDVVHAELAQQLRAIGGLEPDRGRPERVLARPMVWREAADAEHPYEAHCDGQRWQLRLNDFPAEPLYSLLIEAARCCSSTTGPAAGTGPTPSAQSDSGAHRPLR